MLAKVIEGLSAMWESLVTLFGDSFSAAVKVFYDGDNLTTFGGIVVAILGALILSFMVGLIYRLIVKIVNRGKSIGREVDR